MSGSFSAIAELPVNFRLNAFGRTPLRLSTSFAGLLRNGIDCGGSRRGNISSENYASITRCHAGACYLLSRASQRLSHKSVDISSFFRPITPNGSTKTQNAQQWIFFKNKTTKKIKKHKRIKTMRVEPEQIKLLNLHHLSVNALRFVRKTCKYFLLSF